MTEALAEWTAKADRQISDIGVDGYRYAVRQTLDRHDIERLLSVRGDMGFSDGSMAHYGVDLNRRNAAVAALPPPFGDEIKQKMFRAAVDANNDLWRHDGIFPADQVLWNHYPENGFITWHEDTEVGDPRTFTAIVLLKASESGGHLSLNGRGVIDMVPGDCVIFPSHIFHRCSPVTRGTRDSLTLWILSPKNLLEE